jgi:hypothetical protein
MNMLLPGANLNRSGLSQTVILRNLPNNCTKSKLLDHVSESGFAGLFDSFHMPLDQDSGANKGYAFFNFKNSSAAETFRCVFHGKKLPGFNSKKVLVVELARVQSSAQEQCTPTLNQPQKFTATRSLIPAKISLGTPSAIPLHLEGHAKLTASNPVKVMVSEVRSEKPVAHSTNLLSCGEYDEARTPSISDIDSASDDEMKPFNKMQIKGEMPVFMYRMSF